MQKLRDFDWSEKKVCKIVRKIELLAEQILPEPLLPLLKLLKITYVICRDAPCLLRFALSSNSKISFPERLSLIRKLRIINKNIQCLHTQLQILPFITSILSIPPDKEGCIVEAGSYIGGSTAKFSIVAKLANRQLVVFDSFEGLPENVEPHDKSILGHSVKDWYKKGSFCARLDEVKNNVEKFGELEVCTFVKGWFEDTIPAFSQKICAVYLDVDLASSTRTCLKFLYPLIIPGGVLYSHDGDLPLVIEVYNDDKFWEQEVGCRKPYIEGLGKHKVIKIVKPDK